MTFISRARRPAAAAWSEGLYWLDAAIEFVNVEKRLIVRQVIVAARGNYLAAFSQTIRTYAIILAHAWFYAAINKSMSGSISILEFTASAFAAWLIIGGMMRKGTPTHITLASNLPLRIRWINLFVADLIWLSLKILLGVAACYLTYYLFPCPSITGDGPRPDILLISALVLLAGLLGVSIGMVFHAVRIAVPILDGVMEVVTWFMFISSGLYDTYMALPMSVRPIFVLNPAMTVVEYARAAMHPGYPVGDLNLAYPVVATFVLLILGFMLNRRHNQVEVP